MHGPTERMVAKLGKSYTVRNASGGGGRDTSSYSDDGSLTGVLERRSRTPQAVTLSSGEEVESTLEIRAVDVGPTIRERGDADGYPTKLVHPSAPDAETGPTYEVVASHPEDSGVTVLTVVRD